MIDEEKECFYTEFLKCTPHEVCSLLIYGLIMLYKKKYKMISSKSRGQISSYYLSPNDKKPAYERYFTMSNYILENISCVEGYLKTAKKILSSLKTIRSEEEYELFASLVGESANFGAVLEKSIKSEEAIFNSGKIGANLYIPDYDPSAIEEAKEKVDASYLEIIEKYGKKGKRRVK